MVDCPRLSILQAFNTRPFYDIPGYLNVEVNSTLTSSEYQALRAG